MTLKIQGQGYGQGQNGWYHIRRCCELDLWPMILESKLRALSLSKCDKFDNNPPRTIQPRVFWVFFLAPTSFIPKSFFPTLWPWPSTHDLEKLITSGHCHYQCVCQIWEQTTQDVFIYYIHNIHMDNNIKYQGYGIWSLNLKRYICTESHMFWVGQPSGLLEAHTWSKQTVNSLLHNVINSISI